MDVAGLLDDMKERVRTQGATPFVGGGMRGAFLRGLLGLDPAEESTQAQVRAYQTGQALSNSPTPLALAAAPAAIAKAGKAAKAKKPLPREEALETARKNAVEMLGLPEGNTAMDRARAMGFNDKPYHGTFGRFENFDLSKANPRSQYMPGIFTADDPKLAENFGDYIMPLLQRKGTTVIDKRNARNAGLPLPEVDTIYDKAAGIRVTNKPENIRSRFAAFDPKRINDPDLLASLAAFGVGLPVLGLLAEEE